MIQKKTSTNFQSLKYTKKLIEQEPAHLIAEFAFGSYTKEI